MFKHSIKIKKHMIINVIINYPHQQLRSFLVESMCPKILGCKEFDT